PLLPQLKDEAKAIGSASKGKRAIVAITLTNMRGLPISLNILRSLSVSILYTSIVVSCGCQSGSAQNPDSGRPAAMPLEDLQRSFVELRFGMFLHFGILTYTGSWAQPNLDITMFNPTQLDPNQWADAAVSAGMKFGVLTTHHHDGFALWDSQVSTFDVGSIPWMDGKGDVVRAYVDAFRGHGLLPGLYYS